MAALKYSTEIIASLATMRGHAFHLAKEFCATTATDWTQIANFCATIMSIWFRRPRAVVAKMSFILSVLHSLLFLYGSCNNNQKN